MMNDVRFLGGHGTNKLDGTPREPLQQHAHRRSRPEPALGRPVSEPVGHRRRRRDVLRHLDAQHVRAGGHAGLGHVHRGPRLRDVERAPRALRGRSCSNVSNWRIYALQTEEERGEGGFALPLEIDDSQQHHDRELPHLPRDQHVPAVPVRDQGRGLEEHPVPERPLLQQQQGLVRHDRLRPDARRRDPAARVRVADVSGRAPAARPKRPPAVASAAGAKVRAGSRAASSTSPAAPSIRPATSTSWTRTGSASIAGHAATRQLSTVRDNALDPVNLAFDKAGNLMVSLVCRERNRLRLQAGSPGGDDVALLKPEPVAPRPGMTPCCPSATGASTGTALTQPARPVRLARRHHVHARRTGLRQRRHELGRQEQRPAARLRPRAPRRRAAVLHHRRVRSDDLGRARSAPTARCRT